MLILASESPRRRELLQQLKIPFTVQSARVCELEQPPAGCSVSVLPEMNAQLKAAAVSVLHPEAQVIGADTAIVFADRLIGKPRDPEDARRILRLLSGHTHEVVTGITVMRGGKNPFRYSWSEVSRVTFKTLDEQTIGAYLSLVHVLDKAGAYAVQEHGDMIISEISGDMNNIIGLPLEKLHRVLTAAASEDIPVFADI